MIEFHVLSLFPHMFDAFMQESIARRAIEAGHIRVEVHDFRQFTEDRHGRVDDYPFGGGAGMLIAPQSVFEMCIRDRNHPAGH